MISEKGTVLREKSVSGQALCQNAGGVSAAAAAPGIVADTVTDTATDTAAISTQPRAQRFIAKTSALKIRGLIVRFIFSAPALGLLGLV